MEVIAAGSDDGDVVTTPTHDIPSNALALLDDPRQTQILRGASSVQHIQSMAHDAHSIMDLGYEVR